jgi:hypothetical protein
MLRGALVLLLVATGCLFAVGSTIERHHRHHESTAAKSSEAKGGQTTSESGGETGSESSKPTPAEHGASPEAGARILGINTESLALSIIAVVASLLLAAAVWLRPVRLVLVAVVVFGLVFAAGDGRELVHQLDDSNSGLAAVAALLLVLHLAVAALAAAALPRRGDSTSLPLPQAAG